MNGRPAKGRKPTKKEATIWIVTYTPKESAPTTSCSGNGLRFSNAGFSLPGGADKPDSKKNKKHSKGFHWPKGLLGCGNCDE